MGNEFKITQMFNDINNQQLTLTQNDIKTKIKQINHSFQHNKKGLGLKIVLDEKLVKYDRRNWKRSTIGGKVIILHEKILNRNSKQQQQNVFEFKQHEQHQHQQKRISSLQNEYPITISPQDLNTLHQQITNLSIITSTTNTNTIQQQQQQQTPTPGQQTQQDQCCICLQNKTSMVLPCSHAFCDQCTIKYIIQAQQKKCPQCRHQIKGSRQTVGRQIFTVVQDQQVFEQVRKDVLHVIGRMNSIIVQKILQITGWKG